jgi:hypothetical protein
VFIDSKFTVLGFLISGFLTSIGKTSREALISKEPTKFVVKISVNSRSKRFQPDLASGS